MGESVTNIGIFGNKKAKIPKFDEKNQALETLLLTIQGIPVIHGFEQLFRDLGIHKDSGILRFLINELFI